MQENKGKQESHGQKLKKKRRKSPPLAHDLSKPLISKHQNSYQEAGGSGEAGGGGATGNPKARFPQSWGRCCLLFSITWTFILKTCRFLATLNRRSSIVHFQDLFGRRIDLPRKDETPPKIIAWNAF